MTEKEIITVLSEDEEEFVETAQPLPTTSAASSSKCLDTDDVILIAEVSAGAGTSAQQNHRVSKVRVKDISDLPTNAVELGRLDREIRGLLIAVQPSERKVSSMNSVSLEHYEALQIKFAKKRNNLMREAPEILSKLADLVADTAQQLRKACEFDVSVWTIIRTFFDNFKVSKVIAAAQKDKLVVKGKVASGGATLQGKHLDPMTSSVPDVQVQQPVFDVEQEQPDDVEREEPDDVERVEPDDVERIEPDDVVQDHPDDVDFAIEDLKVDDVADVPAESWAREQKKLKKVHEYEKKIVKKLSNTIKKLGTEEVDLNDLNGPENTPFLQVGQLEEKYMKCYRQLCDFTGSSYHTDRPTQKKIKITSCTQYPEFESVVQEFINSQESLYAPNFLRIFELISLRNEKSNLELNEETLKAIAKNLLEEVIAKIRQRRLKDTATTGYSCLAFSQFRGQDDVEVHRDPADTDPELARKLAENKQKWKTGAEAEFRETMVQLHEMVVPDDMDEDLGPSPPESDDEMDDENVDETELPSKISESVATQENAFDVKEKPTSNTVVNIDDSMELMEVLEVDLVHDETSHPPMKKLNLDEADVIETSSTDSAII